MAIPKVCGIETEYGIQVVNGDPNPIAASSVLINAYAHDVARQQIGWDFEDEAPGNDARGSAKEGSMPPMVETHLVNTVLTNGARYYVDHAHPEFSSPECRDAARGRCATTGPARPSSSARWRPPTPRPTTAPTSSSTRTTRTARATPTAATRTT